ncbi:MAG: response regulator transcription factor [Gemmatimonadaceae bacterium]|jgi:two-component system copper resistance phosphate regulon response regulator CusR|nr:response regulator transcription factor [Gemmatimonadaceae bacterium]
MRLLFVEDDARLAAAVTRALREAGFAVDHAPLVAEADRLARRVDYDAIVLDVRLPDGDGFALCRTLRARGVTARILMATARDGVDDRVAGLDLGADDYIVKPYATSELVARLRALLRRPSETVPVVLRVGDLALDTATRRARRGPRAIELTAKEYAVLEVLLRRAGQVVTRDELARRAWDDNFDPFSNVVDVYIARLRRKLEAPGESALLHTERGAGYRLEGAA